MMNDSYAAPHEHVWGKTWDSNDTNPEPPEGLPARCWCGAQMPDEEQNR